MAGIRKASALAAAAAIFGLAMASLPAHAITFVTEENPPFNFTAQGKVSGVSTELLASMARKAGIEAKFVSMPWEDAYRQAQADKDTCVYSIARLENRERQLTWVGELAVNKWAVFGRPDFSQPVRSVADLRKLKIGGIVQDAKVEYLKSNAVTNIVESLRDEQNPPRLFLKRDDPNYIDLWVTSYYSAGDIARQAKTGPVKMVYVLRETPLWLACSPRTAKADIDKMKAALDALNKDGTRKNLLADLEKRVTR